MCVILKRLAEAVERAEAALALQELFGKVLAGLRGRKGMPSLAKCVSERMCVDCDARMVFVESSL